MRTCSAQTVSVDTPFTWNMIFCSRAKPVGLQKCVAHLFSLQLRRPSARVRNANKGNTGTPISQQQQRCTLADEEFNGDPFVRGGINQKNSVRDHIWISESVPIHPEESPLPQPPRPPLSQIFLVRTAYAYGPKPIGLHTLYDTVPNYWWPLNPKRELYCSSSRLRPSTKVTVPLSMVCRITAHAETTSRQCGRFRPCHHSAERLSLYMVETARAYSRLMAKATSPLSLHTIQLGVFYASLSLSMSLGG